jgi:N-acetylneuraminic acid mutarotase
MIVWGGRDVPAAVNTGSRYDPVGNSWSATATAGAATARSTHSAVWTGTEMIVWGGLTTAQAALNTGGRYNPTSNTWSAVATSGAPSARYGHVAVWTGSHMLIWGGTSDGVNYLSNGARYDPGTNTWLPMSTIASPGRRAFASFVFDSARSELVVWGGTFRTNEVPDTPRADGARYDAAHDSWAPMNEQLAVPAARARAAAVWTGSEMLVWGGDPNGGALPSGGRYAPLTVCGTGDCRQVGSSFCSAGAIGFACQPLAPTPEVCDGHDNDCNDVGDDGIPVPTGRPNVLAARIPGGELELSWGATPDTTHYDVVRGGLGSLLSSAGNFTISFDVCKANDISGVTTLDSATPPAGNGYWYLVRPVNLCSGNGTYDGAIPPQVGLHDAEIAAASGTCP